MFLVFDVETNGLPVNYQASVKELDNWPRVIQLAWAFFDHNCKQVAGSCSLIQPDGWDIPHVREDVFYQQHGFSMENLRERGIPIRHALERFLKRIEDTQYLIAHNIEFDKNVLGAECLRTNLRATNKPKRICTMKAGINVCKIRGRYGDYKWPSLMELHQALFRKGFKGAHDAMADVIACSHCFFEMVNRNIIPIQFPVTQV